MYQRSKIQEESLLYENMKHSGELPIIGVNTFLREGAEEMEVSELIRSSDEEKEEQISELEKLHNVFSEHSPQKLAALKETVLRGDNIFAELLETVKYCSLGQITDTLFALGGSYRRNM